MPNPSGVNSFNKFAPEPAYGERVQQRQLEQAAPVPTNPAINEPRRARKRGAGGAAPAQESAPPPPPPQVSSAFSVAQAWAEIATIPGASPLVQELAQRAANG